MIRAAFFDIDGTLMAHNLGAVPEDTLQALQSLKKKGIYVFTSTGRHILELDELGISPLGFDGHVLLNGQLCLDGERRVLAAAPVPQEDIRNVLPFFEKKEIPMSFVEKDMIYASSLTTECARLKRLFPLSFPGLESGGEAPFIWLMSLRTTTRWAG